MANEYCRPPALMFGVPIDDLSMQESLRAIGELVVTGRRQQRTHQIATVNVDFLVNAVADEQVRGLLQHADLCLADGMPVVWGIKALGMPFGERVAGADLVPLLAERAASAGWRIHLFGAAEGVAEHAAELLKQRYPGVSITADSGPFIKDIDCVDESVIESIAGIDPDILCVALGNPKQERFIEAYRQRLRTPVMIGVGGSLDLLVGVRRRAPRWIQRIGFEWVVRAAQEPGRLGKRYAHDARVFFPRLASSYRAVRRNRGTLSLGYAISDNSVSAQVTDSATTSALGWLDAVSSLEHGAKLRLDLEQAAPLSTAALSELIGLIRSARRCECGVQIGSVSPALRSQVDALGLAAYLDEP